MGAMNSLIRHLLALLLAATCTTLAAQGNVRLPDLGDPSLASDSYRELEAEGEKFYRQVREYGYTIEDAEIRAYINDLGYRLVAQSQEPEQQFTFFIVKQNGINAFAAPGGYIGINAGLILAADNESELAGVMAHEISHITQDHLSRQLEAQSKMSIPLAAALIASLILGATVDSQAGMAAAMTTQAIAIQKQINYTRAHESEADRVGIGILVAAGFDPDGMATFFEKLERQTRLYASSVVPEYLSTHPVNASRVAEARTRVEQLGATGEKDSQYFQLMKAKLLVVMADHPSVAVRDLKEHIRGNTFSDEIAARYGYALALLRSGQGDVAWRELDELIAFDKPRATYLLAMAQAEMVMGQTDRAVERFEKLREDYPTHMALMDYYSRALLFANRFDDAELLLREAVIAHPREADFYQLLGQAATGTGNLAGTRLAMCEFYYLNGRPQDAMLQLRSGLRLPDLDYYERARMTARLDDLEKEQLRLAKDERSVQRVGERDRAGRGG